MEELKSRVFISILAIIGFRIEDGIEAIVSLAMNGAYAGDKLLA